jgi:protein-tyrosine phosphatase
MHDRDLHCYASLNLGTSDLLEFYKKKGFDVVSIPWEDPHHKRTKPNEKRRMLLHVREKALTAYDALTKPVLVQCSAGIDRSSPVAAFIYVKRVQ